MLKYKLILLLSTLLITLLGFSQSKVELEINLISGTQINSYFNNSPTRFGFSLKNGVSILTKTNDKYLFAVGSFLFKEKGLGRFNPSWGVNQLGKYNLNNFQFYFSFGKIWTKKNISPFIMLQTNYVLLSNPKCYSLDGVSEIHYDVCNPYSRQFTLTEPLIGIKMNSNKISIALTSTLFQFHIYSKNNLQFHSNSSYLLNIGYKI